MRGGGYRYTDNPQYAAYESLFDELPSANADIVFVGDSLTARCSFQEFLPEKVVINRGIGSDTSEGVLNRIDNVTKHSPDAIFIMIGVNDIGHDIPIAEIVGHVKDAVDLIMNELPSCDVYILSVLPTVKKAKQESILELNNAYRQLCAENDATYIDLHPLFLLGDEINAQFYAPDGVHLNGAGYRVWMDAIMKLSIAQ